MERLIATEMRIKVREAQRGDCYRPRTARDSKVFDNLLPIDFCSRDLLFIGLLRVVDLEVLGEGYGRAGDLLEVACTLEGQAYGQRLIRLGCLGQQFGTHTEGAHSPREVSRFTLGRKRTDLYGHRSRTHLTVSHHRRAKEGIIISLSNRHTEPNLRGWNR